MVSLLAPANTQCPVAVEALAHTSAATVNSAIKDIGVLVAALVIEITLALEVSSAALLGNTVRMSAGLDDKFEPHFSLTVIVRGDHYFVGASLVHVPNDVSVFFCKHGERCFELSVNVVVALNAVQLKLDLFHLRSGNRFETKLEAVFADAGAIYHVFFNDDVGIGIPKSDRMNIL